MSTMPVTDLPVEIAADAGLRRLARKIRAVMDELALDPRDPHLAGTSPPSAPSPIPSAATSW